MPRGNVAKRRAPNGVVTAKPVYVRLWPEELQKFKARAATEGRSLGNMGRVLILSALAQPSPNKLKQDVPQRHATSVVED